MNAKDYIERCKEPGRVRERSLSREVASGVFRGGLGLLVVAIAVYVAYQIFSVPSRISILP